MKRLVVVLACLAGSAAADEPDPKPCAKDPKVCLEIGKQYLNGVGTARDPAKALAFYQKACARKVAQGCGFAATMLLFGNGVAKDEKRGNALRVEACTLNDGMSCNDLGSDWMDGKHGVARRDLAKGKRFYEKACALRDGMGCFNLGNVYRVGEGVRVDTRRALGLFQKSCDLGASKGCTELGVAYYEGSGVAKDPKKAIELLTRACKLGSDVACKNVELLTKRRP